MKIENLFIDLDTNTYKVENLLLINDSILNMICFSTKTNLEIVCSCDKIFVEGTFEFYFKYFLSAFHDTWFTKWALYSINIILYCRTSYQVHTNIYFEF